MFKEHVYWSDAGKELYNQANPEKAKALLKEAGYDGREIRLLTTEQYAYMYKTAVNLQNQLSTIGVPAKIILSDWPSMYERWKKRGILGHQLQRHFHPFRPQQSQHSVVQQI